MSLTNKLASRGRVLDARPEKRAKGSARPTGETSLPARRRVWACGPVLNQGTENICTGIAWAALFLAEPFAAKATARQGNALGAAIWRWSSSGLGSSQAGGKYATDHGLIDSYASVPDIADLAQHVATTGPVVVSLLWYPSMSNPDRRGLIKVTATGNVGGHCLLVTGYDPKHVTRPARGKGKRRRPARTTPAFRLRNSWGRWWGIDGDAWITASDLDRLLSVWDWADVAVAPVGRHPVNVPALLNP